MRRTLLIIILLALGLHNSVNAQIAPIKQPYTDTLLCIGVNFTTKISPTGKFRDGNIFRIQLSDSNGNFNNPKQIGFQPGDSFATVPCFIDTTVIPATGYRIRVVADSPYTGGYPYISPNNGVDIRISKLPEVTVSYNTPICEGDTLKLQASTNSQLPSYSWTGPNGFTSTMQRPIKASSNINDTGTYRVYTTSYGCTSEDTIDVDIFPAPIIDSLGANSPVCEDEDLDLHARCDNCPKGSNLSKPRWYLSDGTLVSTNFTLIYKNIKSKDSGSYKFTVEVGSCFLDTTIYIKTKPLPDTPTIISNSPLCAGDTLRLNGNTSTSGVTYRWEGPAGYSASGPNATRPNIQSNHEGTYYVYARKNGCDSKAGSTLVKVGIPLTPLPISGDSTLCPGDRLSIQAQTSRTDGIKWFHLPNDSIIISTNRLYGASTVTPADSGLYVVTQEVNGCISPPSYININIPNIKSPDPQNNGPLCLGERLELTAIPSNGAAYTWSGPNGFNETSVSAIVNTIGYADTGIYSCITTLLHCADTGTTNVSVKPMPVITDISSNSPVCSFSELELYANSSVPGSDFSWTGPGGFNSNEQNPKIYFEEDRSGTYSVKVVADGCESAEATTTVETKEGPGPGSASSNSPLTEGDKLLLFSENQREGVSFFWEGPDGFSSNEQNPTIEEATYRNDGIYEVTFMYNGCTTKAKTLVLVEDILGISAKLYPNPNNGKFIVEGFTQTDDQLNFAVISSLGKVVYKGSTIPDRSKFFKEIELDNVPSGVYMLQLSTGRESRIIHFTVVRQ